MSMSTYRLYVLFFVVCFSVSVGFYLSSWLAGVAAYLFAVVVRLPTVRDMYPVEWREQLKVYNETR